MKLNREELKYLSQVLSAKSPQPKTDHTNHQKIEQKINDEIYRLSV